MTVRRTQKGVVIECGAVECHAPHCRNPAVRYCSHEMSNGRKCGAPICMKPEHGDKLGRRSFCLAHRR